MTNDFADFLKSAVDDTLTVATAREKGYRHVLDIDQRMLDDLDGDISRMVREEGYTLGKPSTWPEKETEQERGLYEPLQSHQESGQKNKLQG